VPLRVLVVERHARRRRALVQALRAEGFDVVAEAGAADVTLDLAQRLDLDLALVDADLADLDGIELAAELTERHPAVRVVVTASATGPREALRAVRAGAAGYLSKSLAASSLAPALRGVSRGEGALSRRYTATLMRELHRQARERGPAARQVRSRLTEREWQVLNLLADGRRTGEIAAELVVSVETVRSHVKSIMRRLGVHTRAAAIACLDIVDEPLELVD
jgi:two-component system, NarL family, response regulator LiaR